MDKEWVREKMDFATRMLSDLAGEAPNHDDRLERIEVRAFFASGEVVELDIDAASDKSD